MKTNKNDWGAGKKTNRFHYKLKLKTSSLNQKGGHKDNYKEIFEELIKERFDKKKRKNDLIYYFKRNTFRKRFDDLKKWVEIYKKKKFGETKLEEAKNLQSVFK